MSRDSRPDTGDPQQGSLVHPGTKPTSSKLLGRAKRVHSVADAPAFKELVDSETNAATPAEPRMPRGVDLETGGTKPAVPGMPRGVELVASAASNQVAASEIQVRIEKAYKIRVERAGIETRVSGELHLVPWGRYTSILDGLIAAIADLLKVSVEKIRKESDIATRSDGMAHPAFRLTIARPITDEEQQDLNVAIHSFRQRLRGQDESLIKDLFANARPEAVAVGARAAEGVRREASRRDLPQALTVNAGGRDAAPIRLEGRIGGHPDPEQDGASVPLTGNVIGVLSEVRKIWIRCFKFKNKDGKEVSTKSGKKFVINYSDKEHKADALALPNGQHIPVTFIVIPRTGRGTVKLILKTIKKGSDVESAEGRSSTTP